MKSLHVLAIEPYFGGSHRAFLEGVAGHSGHRWTLVTGAAKHWKWRMRVAPLALAQAACRAVAASASPDLVFCSDMLDVPSWLGMVERIDDGTTRWIDVPMVTYFHENQWTYPQAPRARVDLHFGYTNLLSAIASTQCFFNSDFHRESFLQASESFVSRMPDSKSVHDFRALRAKCRVISPGFDPPQQMPDMRRTMGAVINIGWVSRWEHDKRPDRFFDLLNLLEQASIDFRLILLGPRPKDSEELAKIRHQFGHRIIQDKFAKTKDDYWRTLEQIDIVVSTADHEFFGIAVCEAIWAGAAPVLPNRLSYPELVPPENLYDSIEQATSMIASMVNVKTRRTMADDARESIRQYQIQRTVGVLDEAIEQLGV